MRRHDAARRRADRRRESELSDPAAMPPGPADDAERGLIGAGLGLRREFLDMLGLDPLPEKTPLNARTTGSLERGGDALARYAENQRLRGLTYLAQRLFERAGTGGVLVSPAVLRALLQLPATELLAEAWGSTIKEAEFEAAGAALEKIRG